MHLTAPAYAKRRYPVPPPLCSDTAPPPHSELGRDITGAVIKVTQFLQVVLPYIAEENSDEDPEVQIKPDSESPAATAAKSAIFDARSKAIYPKIATFVQELVAGKPAGQNIEQSTASAAAGTGRDSGAAAQQQPPAASATNKPAEAAASSKASAASSSAHAANGAKAAGSAPAQKQSSERARTIEITESFYASARHWMHVPDLVRCAHVPPVGAIC